MEYCVTLNIYFTSMPIVYFSYFHYEKLFMVKSLVGTYLSTYLEKTVETVRNKDSRN